MKRKHEYRGENTRLDQYLVTLFPHISRSYLQQMITQGSVLVNQKKSKKGHILTEGDLIEIQSFVEPNDRTIDPNPAVGFTLKEEFEHYIVIDKPPFVATHPNQFDDHQSLANGLVSRFPQMIGVGEDPLRPGIVHRLDSNTSGVMLAAKTQEGFAKLRELFNQRKIKKTYQALVVGQIIKEGSIETDVAHHPKNPRRMIALTHPNQEFRSRRRNATTLYEPMKQFGGYTLVSVRTLTGRMHQVRVHLASIGHPLVGDTLYQSPKEKNLDKLGLTRHFLHAVRLEFDDPWSQTPRIFESKLSNDLQSIIATL